MEKIEAVEKEPGEHGETWEWGKSGVEEPGTFWVVVVVEKEQGEVGEGEVGEEKVEEGKRWVQEGEE